MSGAGPARPMGLWDLAARVSTTSPHGIEESGFQQEALQHMH